MTPTTTEPEVIFAYKLPHVFVLLDEEACHEPEERYEHDNKDQAVDHLEEHFDNNYGQVQVG